MEKRQFRLDTPIVIGFSCNWQSWECSNSTMTWCTKNFDRHKFRYVNMDTDSAYFAMSDEFFRCIKLEKCKEFFEHYHHWFALVISFRLFSMLCRIDAFSLKQPCQHEQFSHLIHPPKSFHKANGLRVQLCQTDLCLYMYIHSSSLEPV